MNELIEQIKRRAKGRRHISFTRTFGISREEFAKVNLEMEELLRHGMVDEGNFIMIAAAVFEEALGIPEYTPEQLLRLAIVLQRLEIAATMGTVLAAIKEELSGELGGGEIYGGS